MKKFEPHYRLVRYGAAKKIEKASRQQRMHVFLIIALAAAIVAQGLDVC